MARYEHLPVYKSAYVLSREVYRVQEKLPKGLRYSLGSMAFESTLRCVKGIVYANGASSKSKALNEVALEIEVLWTYLRMLYDFKGLSKGEFQLLSERLNEVAPQVHAWTKWEKGKANQAKKAQEPQAKS